MYQIPKIPSIEETRCSLCDRFCIKYSCFDKPHQLTEHRRTSLIKRKKEKVSKRERERDDERARTHDKKNPRRFKGNDVYTRASEFAGTLARARARAITPRKVKFSRLRNAGIIVLSDE